MSKSTAILSSLILLSSFGLTACSGSTSQSANSGTEAIAKLSAAEACAELEVKAEKANQLMDIVLDEYNDSDKMKLVGPKFQEAGKLLTDIKSEDAGVELAINEMGASIVEFGRLLANGRGIFSKKVSAASDNMQLTLIDAQSACSAY